MGKYCDGNQSMSRMTSYLCPNCRVRIPHMDARAKSIVIFHNNAFENDNVAEMAAKTPDLDAWKSIAADLRKAKQAKSIAIAHDTALENDDAANVSAKSSDVNACKPKAAAFHKPKTVKKANHASSKGISRVSAAGRIQKPTVDLIPLRDETIAALNAIPWNDTAVAAGNIRLSADNAVPTTEIAAPSDKDSVSVRDLCSPTEMDEARYTDIIASAVDSMASSSAPGNIVPTISAGGTDTVERNDGSFSTNPLPEVAPVANTKPVSEAPVTLRPRRERKAKTQQRSVLSP